MKLTMFTNMNKNFFKMSKNILFVLAFLISTFLFFSSRGWDYCLEIGMRQCMNLIQYFIRDMSLKNLSEDWANTMNLIFSTDYYVISLLKMEKSSSGVLGVF